MAVLVARVRRAPARLGPVRLVGVDGPAGSGKTTCAAALAGALGPGAAVVHLDDLYDGWTGLTGSLWPRLDAQLLEPLRRGRPGRYQRYDWAAAAFAAWVDVPVPQVLVLEGCGAGDRVGDSWRSLLVWVAAADELRLARGLARDGVGARAHWLSWMADERVHFAAQRTEQRADLHLDAWGTMPGWTPPSTP